MSYLVMEVHPAYAVVLDQEGRFYKVVNFHYQVGQRVEQVMPLRQPQPLRRPLRRLAPLAAAACICLVLLGGYRFHYLTYGVLRIQINPDVELSISRSERVVGLEGINEDGRQLVDGYDYRGKSRDTAVEELVERAIALGYLSDGYTISISVSSQDDDWQQQEEQLVRQQLQDRYGDTVVISIGPRPAAPPSEQSQVVIPVVPSGTEDQNQNDDGNDDDDEDDQDDGRDNEQVPEDPSVLVPGTVSEPGRQETNTQTDDRDDDGHDDDDDQDDWNSNDGHDDDGEDD